jgi:hypothetical protein
MGDLSLREVESPALTWGIAFRYAHAGEGPRRRAARDDAAGEGFAAAPPGPGLSRTVFVPAGEIPAARPEALVMSGGVRVHGDVAGRDVYHGK